MYDNYRFSVIGRILSNSNTLDNGCIEYASTKHKYGLVSFTIDGKRQSLPASRAMYMASTNQMHLPSNVFICHHCDNPRCVNMVHLYQGDVKTNNQDCVTRGRRPKKIAHHNRVRVHDEEKVQAIREAQGLYKFIALRYGVSIGYVSKVKSGKLKA